MYLPNTSTKWPYQRKQIHRQTMYSFIDLLYFVADLLKHFTCNFAFVLYYSHLIPSSMFSTLVVHFTLPFICFVT